ncbi:MAG: acyltransferase family protein [Promethearchaeota archaeon]
MGIDSTTSKSSLTSTNAPLEQKLESLTELLPELTIQKPNLPTKRYFQIDVLKTVMMALVIMDHSFTHAFLHDYASPFWERISIPVLMVIMGFNTVISYNASEAAIGHNLGLRELYSWAYFKKKIERFLIPYITLYIIHYVLLVILTRYAPPTIDNFPYESVIFQYYGFTPFWGPGMWFIPVMLSSILVLPILYYCFRRLPVITFLATFGIEFGMQLAKKFLYQESWWFTSFFWITNILYLFSGVGMGMWIAKDTLQGTRNRLVRWLFLLPSLVYLYFYSFVDNFKTILYLSWLSGDYHFLTFPYSAILVVLVLKLFPNELNSSQPLKKKLMRGIQTISKSTFHILLTQILWFSLWYHYWFNMQFGFDATPEKYLWFYPLNLSVGFVGGVLWHEAEIWFFSKIKEIPINAFIYYILFLLSIIFYVIWFFGQFWAFVKYPIPSQFYIV